MLGNAKSYPTHSGIVEIDVFDWDGDGVVEIFLLSGDERLMAVSRGEWMGIHYVLDPVPTADDAEPPPFYQIIAPAEYPHQPMDERPRMSKKELPANVRFRHLLLSSNQSIEGGSWDVLFSPSGNTGSHIVVLDGEEERVQSLKFNAITGLIDFFGTAEVTFRRLEE